MALTGETSQWWDDTSPGDAGDYASYQDRRVWASITYNANKSGGLPIGHIPNSGASATITPLNITETSPATRAVQVNVGRAFVYGGFYRLPTAGTLDITANSSGSTRIDSVILTSDSTAQTIRMSVKAGTAGSGVPPTLTQTYNETTGAIYWEEAIAYVTVATGALTIVNANIDTSPNVPIQAVTQMVKTTASTNAPSTFQALWTDANQRNISPLLVVMYTDFSAIFFSTNQGTTWLRLIADNGGYAVVSYQLSSGTAAAASVGGAWTTYILNTTDTDVAGLVTALSSNRVTLQAGSYYVSGFVTLGGQQMMVRLRLQNITDGTTLVSGNNSRTTENGITHSLLGRFTVAASKQIELQYYGRMITGVVGAAQPVTTGANEIYAQLAFTRAQ